MGGHNLLKKGTEGACLSHWPLVRKENLLFQLSLYENQGTNGPQLQGVLFLCCDFLKNYCQKTPVVDDKAKLHSAPCHVNGIWRVLLKIYSTCTFVTLKLKLSWYETDGFVFIYFYFQWLVLRRKFASYWLIKWNEGSALMELIFGVGINPSGNDDCSDEWE